jgi:hypothetical protein
LYVFGVPVDAAIEWLVVRPHPDDAAIVLLAPADDFPLAGRADVPLRSEFVDRPLTVRCGEAIWVPASACREHICVGIVPDEAVTLVRQKLAGLARGNLPDQPGAPHIEADPEYAAWMAQVGKSRESVEQRGDPSPLAAEGIVLRFERFTAQPPRDFAEEPQVALAAKSGGKLLASLAESLASDSPRFLEVALHAGGTLLVAAGASVVRVAWKGPNGADPPSLSATGPAGRVVAQWRAGTQIGVHRAEPAFAWVDGQVTFLVGTDQPETFTVRL